MSSAYVQVCRPSAYDKKAYQKTFSQILSLVLLFLSLKVVFLTTLLSTSYWSTATQVSRYEYYYIGKPQRPEINTLNLAALWTFFSGRGGKKSTG